MNFKQLKKILSFPCAFMIVYTIYDWLMNDHISTISGIIMSFIIIVAVASVWTAFEYLFELINKKTDVNVDDYSPKILD